MSYRNLAGAGRTYTLKHTHPDSWVCVHFYKHTQEMHTHTYTHSLRSSPAEVWMQSAARRWGQIMFWITELHCWAHLALEWSASSLASCHLAIMRLGFFFLFFFFSPRHYSYLISSKSEPQSRILTQNNSLQRRFSGNPNRLRLAQQDLKR